MSRAGDVERLLRRALAPVEPPEHLAARLRGALHSLSDMAAEELEGWELMAMRDPRRWARPAAALVASGVATVGLVILERRYRDRARELGAGAVHRVRRLGARR